MCKAQPPEGLTDASLGGARCKEPPGARVAGIEGATAMQQLRVAPRWNQGVSGEPVPRARRPVVVANPASDTAFRRFIEAILLSGLTRPEELEVVLRTRHPDVIVRPRDLAGEQTPVWYVYRDGHWIRSEGDARGR